MSTSEYPHSAGQGLLIPTPNTEATQPYASLGVAIMPSETGAELRLGVFAYLPEGKKQPLGLEYQPVGEIVDNGSMDNPWDIVDQGPSEDITDPWDIVDRMPTWPAEATYTLPYHGNTKPRSMTSVVLEGPSGFLHEQRRRHNQALTTAQHGIGVTATLIAMGADEPTPFSTYDSVSALVASTRSGDIATATVGRIGAGQYLLDAEGNKTHRTPYANILPAANGIYGYRDRGLFRIRRLARYATSRNVSRVTLR